MKKAVLLLSVLVLSLTAICQQQPKQQQQKYIIVSLPVEAWQVVMTALGKLPIEQGVTIYNSIDQQVYLQLQPQPAVADTTKKEKPKTK